jgi:two-component system sensor histidine kinase UhpB
MSKLVLSLRARLMTAIAVALIAALGVGCVITVRQARHSVAREMGSAFAVGRQTLIAVIADLAAAPDPTADLRHLVAAFDGNRHIRVSLIGADGVPISGSALAPTSDRAPLWFVGLIGVPPRTEQLALPPIAAPFRAVRLETDPRNEVLEAWTPFRDATALIALLALGSGVLIWWSITLVLRPLATLSAALQSVGAGEFEARLPADGPPETQVIARAFNRMAQDLSAARDRNRGLYRQLLSAQEAERKEIARDLHDDIGPLLLSIIIDATAPDPDLHGGETAPAVAALRSIAKTVGEAQQHIRAIVNRLRPIGLAEFGLRRAIETLVVFWQRRHPGIIFSLDFGRHSESLDEVIDVTAFRIVQEALTNALRHGAAERIDISFRIETGAEDALILEISDDGRGATEITPGFGLTGMRERVEAAGGRLTLASTPGVGFTVTATLPMAGQDTGSVASMPMAESPI